MGLDQYANARSKLSLENEELAYWRKHPNLQGWMEELYHEKGGTEDFNCVEVELTLEDLDALEKCVSDGGLPPTTGFFFGSPSDERYREQDLEFIEKAREAIANGKQVYYSSWW